MEYFDYNKSDVLGKLWDLLETEIFLVLDFEGINMAEAKVREIDGEGHWLYVDNVNGFEILDSEEVECLTLEPCKTKPKS